MPNKNKSGNSLRILWIPGRKKHHDKGTYKPTNKGQQHKHHQKDNEMWSLGGPKAQENLLNSSSGLTEDGASGVATSMIPSTCAVTATAIGSQLSVDEVADAESVKAKTSENLHTNEDDKTADDNKTEMNDIDRNDASCSGNNTTTLLIRHRKNKDIKKNDMDSIEKLDEIDALPSISTKDQSNGKTYNSINYHINKSKSHRNKYKCNDEYNEKHKKNHKDDEKDKTVQCLYFALVCCECSIS